MWHSTTCLCFTKKDKLYASFSDPNCFHFPGSGISYLLIHVISWYAAVYSENIYTDMSQESCWLLSSHKIETIKSDDNKVINILTFKNITNKVKKSINAQDLW